ncbi:MAG: hypothetical protein MJ137_00630 [Clostridia bacterium]|nr:hypothetical protein [Clostridia bacterium]
MTDRARIGMTASGSKASMKKRDAAQKAVLGTDKSDDCRKGKDVGAAFCALAGDAGGAGAIKTVAVILLLATVLSAVLFYAELFGTVRSLENRMRIVLDSCLMRESLIIYGSLDDGHDDSVVPSESEFIKVFDEQFPSMRTAAGAGGDSSVWAASIGSDGVAYAITEPLLSCSDDGHLRLEASFTVIYPVFLAGKKLFDARVPVRVESRYVSMY